MRSVLDDFVCIWTHWSYSTDPGWEIVGSRILYSEWRPVSCDFCRWARPRWTMVVTDVGYSDTDTQCVEDTITRQLNATGSAVILVSSLQEGEKPANHLTDPGSQRVIVRSITRRPRHNTKLRASWVLHFFLYDFYIFLYRRPRRTRKWWWCAFT